MHPISWTLILLALISAVMAFIFDTAQKPYKMGTFKQSPKQTIAALPPFRTSVSAPSPMPQVPVKCKTNDLGKWGPERQHIKTTKCGNTQVTLIGKWRN